MDDTNNIRNSINNFIEFTYSDKIFNAHELGEELLVNYLHRKSKENDIIHFSTLFNKIFRTSFIQKPPSAFYKLSNGWDIVARKYYHDKKNNILAIPVVASTNRILEIIKDEKNNYLSLELSILRLVYTSLHRGSEPRLAIIAIDRIFTDYKHMPTSAFNFIEPSSLLNNNDIVEMLVERTNQLESYLNTTSEPAKCVGIKYHRQKGKSINMTCTYYCNVSDGCKHKNNFVSSRIKLNKLIF
ncbi:MAG: hypothetical protein L3I99_05545 [Sulfurimonas sp.]|nr:hypothetical protein [Sulfurimonas sp.]